MSLLVGIAGGSCSGKTTLARLLVDELGDDGTLMGFDDYYCDLGHMSYDERTAVNFDHPDALDFELFTAHLAELSAGRPVDAPVYDFGAYTRTTRTRRVPATPVVVLDGILLLAVEACRSLLGLSIFVAAPESERLTRRLRRDIVERGRDPDSVKAQFATTVAPMHDRFVDPSAVWADLGFAHPFDPSEAVAEVLGEISSRI